MSYTIEEIEAIRQQEKEKSAKEKEFSSKAARASVEQARALIEQKKAELEVKRLERELERLEKPDTSLDYYGQMLKMQEQNHLNIMEMQKQNFSTQLELARLQSGGGESDDYLFSILEMVKPVLPQLFASLGKNSSQKSPTIDDKQAVNANIREVSPMDKQKELDEYKAKIRAGEVTEEQGFKDFQEQIRLGNIPKSVQMTKEQFHFIFEGIKNGNE